MNLRCSGIDGAVGLYTRVGSDQIGGVRGWSGSEFTIHLEESSAIGTG